MGRSRLFRTSVEAVQWIVLERAFAVLGGVIDDRVDVARARQRLDDRRLARDVKGQAQCDVERVEQRGCRERLR